MVPSSTSFNQCYNIFLYLQPLDRSKLSALLPPPVPVSCPLRPCLLTKHTPWSNYHPVDTSHLTRFSNPSSLRYAAISLDSPLPAPCSHHKSLHHLQASALINAAASHLLCTFLPQPQHKYCIGTNSLRCGTMMLLANAR